MNRTGEIFHNNNGSDYFIIYQNPELGRALLCSIKTGYYIGVCGLDFQNNCWDWGHYFMNDFESAVNYVLGKEVN